MSVAVNCLGASPPDLWNAYNWNAFLWGAGTEKVPTTVVRQLSPQIANSVTPSSAENFRLVRLLAAQTITPGSSQGNRFRYGIPTQSVGMSGTIAHEYVQESHGYYRVFPEQVTDFVLGSTPTWSASSSTPVSWTTQTVTTTTWS